MRVLVLGHLGQLGSSLMHELRRRLHEAYGTDVKGEGDEFLDITDSGQVAEALDWIRPRAVILCSAYTAVDKAEEDDEACRELNSVAPGRIARLCRERRTPLTYISTDYIFDGEKGAPYREGDPTNPLCLYGASKLAGERRVLSALGEGALIVRTGELYAAGGKNFVLTMLELGKRLKEVRVVADQIVAPTWTVPLATVITGMVEECCTGIVHVTCDGEVSWADFARKIFELAEIDCEVVDITSEEYPAAAERPKYSVLEHRRMHGLGFRMPHWEEALREFISSLKSED